MGTAAGHRRSSESSRTVGIGEESQREREESAAGEGENDLGFGVRGGAGQRRYLYTPPSQRRNPTARIAGVGGSNGHDGSKPCRCRARPFSVPCLVLAHGPNVRPRHGHGCGPCQARARCLAGRAGLVPCFLGPCPCRPIGPGPFEKLY